MMNIGNPLTAQSRHPDFLFMVEQAIQAPSGHNTQPWRFVINEGSIEIYPDFTKALPVVDPDNRELFISLGCALENLCIAASVKKYSHEVTISDAGVITVWLSCSETDIPEDTLSRLISLRQTNRRVYDGRKVSDVEMERLKEIPGKENIRIHFYEKGTPEFTVIRHFVEKGNRIQMKDKAFKKELKEWMRFNKKHSEWSRDGLSYRVFGAPDLPRFISKPAISLAINERSQVKGDNKKIDSSSHLVLFTTGKNEVKEWIYLGQALQRFLLESTAMGIVHSYFNQPNEISGLAEEMTDSLRLTGEFPTILIRIGYGEKMPYSKRKNPEDVIRNRNTIH